MDTMTEIFGEAISTYSRQMGISDGALVDVTEHAKNDGFKFPVAMTRAAWAESVEAGGTWEAGADDGEGETLKLPGGQDVTGRLHDVFWMLRSAIKHVKGSRVDFSVLVDVRGDGRHKKVDLYSLCGPGDDMEPVITIMLPTED
jgi:hypothetical protein